MSKETALLHDMREVQKGKEEKTGFQYLFH
jgi:hypothetical protein